MDTALCASLGEGRGWSQVLFLTHGERPIVMAGPALPHWDALRRARTFSWSPISLQHPSISGHPLRTASPLCPRQLVGVFHSNRPVHPLRPARMQRWSLIIFVYCFLIPLCKRTIAIIVASHLHCPYCRAKEAHSDLPLVSFRVMYNGASWGTTPSRGVAEHSQPQSLDYPSQNMFRPGLPDWVCSGEAPAHPGRGSWERGSENSSSAVCPGAESTCWAAVLGMNLQGHPHMLSQTITIITKMLYHPLPSFASFKPKEGFSINSLVKEGLGWIL